MPKAPTWEGYVFVGWYTDVSGGDEFTASTPVTADITVYARWALVDVQPPEAGGFKFVYYWVDADNDAVVTTSDGDLTVGRNEPLTITALDMNVDDMVVEWVVDGITVNETGAAYSFSSNDLGTHNITLVILKNDRPYSTTIIITVE